MWWNRDVTRRRNLKSGAAILLLTLGIVPQAQARDFTAGVVMEEMDAADRFTYVAGVIEGLAYARFAADGQKPEGMVCIYDWFYESGDAMTKIEATFIKYGTYLPGAVLAAMLKKRCP